MDWGIELGIIGVIGIPLAVGLTMTATSTNEFRFVRGCFMVSAFATLCVAVEMHAENEYSLWLRAVIGAIIAAVAVGGLIVALAWVRNKEESSSTTTPNNFGIISPKVDVLFSPGKPDNGITPKIQIGRSGVFFAGSSDVGKLLFPALTESQFKVESIGGKIKISTKISDDSGNLIVEINRNEWQVAPPPRTWDRNYSDSALEVRDDQGDIVLQVRALPDCIQLQGMWWIDMGSPNGIRRLTLWEGPNPNQQKGGAEVVISPKTGGVRPPQIAPMFVYPSSLHLGELIAK
jgi:hypothetical protein